MYTSNCCKFKLFTLYFWFSDSLFDLGAMWSANHQDVTPLYDDGEGRHVSL